MQQYFRAVAMPSRKKKSESDRAALFCKRCIILLRPTFANNANISSDYASCSPLSIRRVQGGFKRRVTKHTLAGYIICLGWCLAFLTLSWPIHNTNYQSEEWASGNWDEALPIACVAGVSLQLGSKELQGSALCSTETLATQATLPIVE